MTGIVREMISLERGNLLQIEFPFRVDPCDKVLGWLSLVVLSDQIEGMR
jgi:hypothetical protein